MTWILQHSKASAPLKWRMLAVPATQFASQILQANRSR